MPGPRLSLKGAGPRREPRQEVQDRPPPRRRESFNDGALGARSSCTGRRTLLTALFAAIAPRCSGRALKLSDYGLSDATRIDPAADGGRDGAHRPTPRASSPVKPRRVHVCSPTTTRASSRRHRPAGPLPRALGARGQPLKTLAFLAGLRLSYFRPGHQVRQICAHRDGAARVVSSRPSARCSHFPVSDELSATVAEHVATIKQTITGSSLDVLTSVVTKVVYRSEASLDLKRWMTGVDLTADRAGFVLANDPRCPSPSSARPRRPSARRPRRDCIRGSASTR